MATEALRKRREAEASITITERRNVACKFWLAKKISREFKVSFRWTFFGIFDQSPLHLTEVYMLKSDRK